MALEDKLGEKAKHESASKTDEPMPPALIERFQSLPGPREKQEIHELPQWVKLALVKRATEDLSYKDAAAVFGKGEKTLQKYGQSPAAAKWLEPLQEFLSDPIAMSRAILQASSLNITLDRLMALQTAKDAGDYKTVDKIAADLQDRVGIVAKKHDANAIQVKINFGGANFDAPVVEAEWEIDGDDE